jgi:hypothetical protein
MSLWRFTRIAFSNLGGRPDPREPFWFEWMTRALK